MAAAEWLTFGGRPDFIETVSGDKPTDPDIVAIGAEYLDLDGVKWWFNGTGWIQITTAAFGAVTIGEVDQGAKGVEAWLVRFLPYTTAAHTEVASDTSSDVALASNADRLYALFVNDSAVVMYLGLDGAAVANKGIRLAANGGYYEMSAAFGNLMLGEVTVISASGSGNNLLVTEGV